MIQQRMDIKRELNALDLNPNYAIVIGSGILNVLGLRECKDIDVVVPPENHESLRTLNRFEQVFNHGRLALTDGVFDIATSWTVLGKTWWFDDLLAHTVIVDGVRYITVDFLFDAKQRWIANGEGRPKDVQDVVRMEAYLQCRKRINR